MRLQLPRGKSKEAMETCCQAVPSIVLKLGMGAPGLLDWPKAPGIMAGRRRFAAGIHRRQHRGVPTQLVVKNNLRSCRAAANGLFCGGFVAGEWVYQISSGRAAAGYNIRSCSDGGTKAGLRI